MSNVQSRLSWTQWKPCSAERFNEMLNILPPRLMERGGFLVGEPWCHRLCRYSGQERAAFAAFVKIGEDHFEAIEPVTAGEFRAMTRETVIANIVPRAWPVASVVLDGWHTLAMMAGETMEAARKRCEAWLDANCDAAARKHFAISIREG